MITTLTGTNNFLLKAELDGLVSRFVAENGDLSLERVDCTETEFDRITEAIQSMPFLASKKLVVLHAPSAQKQFAESFEKLLDTVPNTTDIIIIEPKVDKRSVFYKTLKKLTNFLEFSELDPRSLAQWLVESASKAGGELRASDASYLIDRVGPHQQMLQNELNKLLLYGAKISRETIDLLTEKSPQSTVFELLDAAFAGNIKKTFRLYSDQRAARVEPQAIIGMIAWQLHVLAVVKAAASRAPDDIAKASRISPYVIKKTLGIARKIELSEIKRLVRRTLELDIKLKSQPIDADEAVQHLLLTIAQQR